MLLPLSTKLKTTLEAFASHFVLSPYTKQSGTTLTCLPLDKGPILPFGVLRSRRGFARLNEKANMVHVMCKGQSQLSISSSSSTGHVAI